MSFISQLREFLGPPSVPTDGAAYREELTVAVLLTLVTHADGRVLAVEERELRRMLQSRFDLSEGETGRLIEGACEALASMDPATTLVDRLAQDIPAGERPRVLDLAYRIAAADGVIHEFEDDLIWRTGRLLGLGDAELAAMKRAAVDGPGADRDNG